MTLVSARFSAAARACAAAAAAAAMLFSASASAQAPPPEAYTRGSGVSSMALSPDGQRLAVTTGTYSTSGDSSALQIINLSTNQPEQGFRAPDGALVGGVRWIDNDRIIYSVTPSQRAGDNPFSQVRGGSGIAVMNVRSNDQRLIQLRSVGGANWFPNDPSGLQYIGYEYDENRNQIVWERFGVFRADLEQGGTRHLANLHEDTVGVLFADNGELLARIDSDKDTNRWQFRVYERGGSLRTVLEEVSETGSPPQLVGLLEDGRWAIVGRLNNDDRERMHAFNPANGQIETIVEHERYDILAGLRDRWTNRVVGAEWTEDLPRQRFFDTALQAAYDHLQGVFSAGYATIQSWSADRSRMIVFGETSQDAGSFYLFDANTRSLAVLRRAFPELSGPAALGVRQSITYRARDGTRIPAYLTLPANQTQNLPLVLLVHGGPHARDDFAFDPWAAYLASRGYAVLQPNYRGSAGYGYQWFDAGRGNWGDGVMQTDVLDGVDVLVRSGIADPNRMCIVGASYGGYAALVGATLTPDKFRCAISIAGVSDVVAMLDRFASVRRGGPGSVTSDWWRLSIGDRRGDREHLRQVSPVNHAEQVRIPILLIHGEEDQTVPVDQSRRMHERLRGAGKDVQYIEFEHEFHSFFMQENRARMMREMETFLNRHIGGGAAAN